MQDLHDEATGNSRASNVGPRASLGGPAPSPYSERERLSPGLRTPRDIMKQREAREAAREARRIAEAETQAAEAAEAEAGQQRQRELEERRQSAERRAAAAMAAMGARIRDSGYRSTGTSVGTRTPATNNYASPTPEAGGLSGVQGGSIYNRGDNQRKYTQPLDSFTRTAAYSRPGASVTGTARPPQESTQQSAQSSSQQQQTQERGASTEQQPSSSRHPQGSSAARSRTDPTTSSEDKQQEKASFPQAFERWETLSSHWEGLTSYWIHHMEQNNTEISHDPIAQQMSRQIIDLTAAGANLFHAVVELQRLRASSERKFQRWFYEVKAEQEKSQDVRKELETKLRDQQQHGTSQQRGVGSSHNFNTRTQEEQETKERVLSQMQRELQISKDEARRAWEELGRREQEERERIFALRDGTPITIGGVQVVPTQGSHSHGGSHVSVGDSQARFANAEALGQGRPKPLHGHQPPAALAIRGVQEFMMAPQDNSPTDTDPFTERTGEHASQYQAQHQTLPQIDARTGGFAGAHPATQTVVPRRQLHPPISVQDRQSARSTAPDSDRSARGHLPSHSPKPSAEVSQAPGPQTRIVQRRAGTSAGTGTVPLVMTSREGEYIDDEVDYVQSKPTEPSENRRDTSTRPPSSSRRGSGGPAATGTSQRSSTSHSKAPQIPEDVIRGEAFSAHRALSPTQVTSQYQTQLEILPGPYQPGEESRLPHREDRRRAEHASPRQTSLTPRPASRQPPQEGLQHSEDVSRQSQVISPQVQEELGQRQSAPEQRQTILGTRPREAWRQHSEASQSSAGQRQSTASRTSSRQSARQIPARDYEGAGYGDDAAVENDDNDDDASHGGSAAPEMAASANTQQPQQHEGGLQQQQHHYPTRLSDVLEEEEEERRRSRAASMGSAARNSAAGTQ